MKNIAMMKWLFVGLLFISLTSCMKDEFLESRSDMYMVIDHSKIQGEFSLSNVNIQLQEVNTQVTTATTLVTGADTAKANVTYGTYTATLEGDIKLTIDGEEKNMKVKARQSNIVVNSESTTITLEMFLSDPAANFVIKELFFTGTVNGTTQNNGDKYILLYNNSNDTLYADGLFVAQSTFLTITKRAYTPDVMNEAFTTDQILMVPGTGKQHPVAPGGNYVIATNAIDHTKDWPNSLDLSTADLEIEMSNTANIDNPAVPNAINIAGSLFMHNQGYTSYVMGRFPEGMTTEKYLEENKYSYTYIAANGAVMTQHKFKIPNNYVIDAVNLSVKTGFEWIVTAPELDMGWTYAGLMKVDKDRYGKAVRRKEFGSLENGKPLLKDTNNSTVDFDPAVKPSLMK